MKQYLALLFTLFFFVACAGGGSSSSSSDSSSSSSSSSSGYGYLYDSAITGIKYYVNGKYAGTTQNGKFEFQNDTDIIEFSLGNIYLGKTTGSVAHSDMALDDLTNNISNIITTAMIIDLDVNDYEENKSIILSQFLLSLDDDNNPDNGINIDSNLVSDLENAGISYDFYTNEITQSDLNNTFNTHIGKSIVDKDTAVSHMNITLSTLSGNDYTSLIKPSLLEPFTEIKTRHTTQKKVKITGNIGTQIYMGIPDPSIYANTNFDGNESNIIYEDTGVTINSLGYGELTLDFDNDNKTYFDYYFYTKNTQNNITSDILKLHILKDHIPPYVAEPVINITINEEQYLLQDINASDESDTEFYKIIQYSENNNSVDGADFTISDEGIVTFITKPDFDKNAGKTYSFLARVVDLGNITDVKLNVTLQNILDSAPVLSNNGNFSTSIYEDHNISSVDYNSSFVYDLSSTVDYSKNSYNQYVYPDNDPALSPKYFAIDSNASNYFNIDRDTGVLTLKDNINDLMDYEKYPNEINITFSVENNNTFDHNDSNIIDTNTTYGTLTINILNKIDTIPALNTPSSISVNEKQYEVNSTKILSTITKDISNSDKDLTMRFSITGGNSEDKFSINSTSGEITLKNTLDYETTTEYNLTITATNTFNTWYDTSDHNSSVQLNITIINEIDNPPVIALIDSNASLPESTLSGVEIAHFDVNGTIYDENQTTAYEIFRVDKNTLTDIADIPFIIDSSGTITTKRDLIDDYEELIDQNDTIFTLYVRAYNTWYDNSNTNYSNEIIFTINVTNVTDNIPSILPSDTNVTIDEDFNTNTTIMTFDVNGAQFDQNTIDQYTIISGNDKNLFDISILGTQGSLILVENNRTLGATNALDWETEPVINLTIVGKNTWYDGVVRSSLEHNITINLDNVIEVPPTISVPNTIDVHENFSVGAFVGYIETSGTRVDENSVNNFSIVSSDSKFALQQLGTPEEDSNNTLTLFNTIVVDGTLDYDTNASHQITLRATNDMGTSEKNVTINVIDDINTDLPLLTIIVSFSDTNITTPLADIKTLINTNMYDYFQRVSYNKFTFIKALENYGNDDASTGTINDGVIQITLPDTHPQTDKDVLESRIRSILTKVSVDSLVDFSTFDANSDGNITKDELQILLVLAEDTTIQLDTTLEGSYTLASALNLNGVNVASISDGNCVVVGETDTNNNTITIGIVAKLISEKLFGFAPEDSNYIYDNYDLMGTGYNGYVGTDIEGTTPVHPSIFNKLKQGWIQPVTLRNTTHDLVFYNTHDMNDFNAYKIYINSTDYYLLENRNYTDQIEVPNNSVNYDNGLRAIVTNFTGGLVTWKYTPNNPIKLNLIDLGGLNYTFTENQAISDLPASVQNTFEFINTASIENDTDDQSKQLQIEIEVK